MKKIVVFHHYNSSVGGGLCLLHILRAIDKSRFTISVYLPLLKGDLGNKIEAMDIKVTYNYHIPTSYNHYNGMKFSVIDPRFIGNVIRIIKTKKEIETIIMREKPDIVMVNSMTLFYIGKIAQKHDAKSYCFHRETYCQELFGFRNRHIKQSLHRHFDKVAFISNYDLTKTGGGSNFFRITDKVDFELYVDANVRNLRRELGLPEGRLVLYTGGSSKLKGADTAVKALALIGDPNVKLVFLQFDFSPLTSNPAARIKAVIKVLLGKNFQHKILKYVQRYRLEARIVFVPASDVVEKYFLSCDAVIFPSRLAHQARPIYEAGAAHKPIAVTDFPNTGEFLDNGNGWTFKRGDHKQLSQIIEEMLSGSDEVREKIKKNYQKSYQNNNLNDLSSELDKLFEGVSGR